MRIGESEPPKSHQIAHISRNRARRQVGRISAQITRGRRHDRKRRQMALDLFAAAVHPGKPLKRMLRRHICSFVERTRNMRALIRVPHCDINEWHTQLLVQNFGKPQRLALVRREAAVLSHAETVGIGKTIVDT